jgi:polysaccharide transporter, PST family
LKPFDADGSFRSVAVGDELRRLAVRGAGANLFSQGVSLGVQMIATVILARLLTPADFGVVTMVTTFSLLLANLGLNGITEAIIQREELGHSLASNLFWVTLGGGLILTIGFASAGSLMARFYGNVLVSHVAVGVSLTILVTSASVLHQALLMRSLHFSAVYMNQIVARLISVVVSILLAWTGWGYWSLVAGLVAQPLSECVGAWSLCRWIPSLPHRMLGTYSMVRFAAKVYGRFTFNYFARNMDNLLVGWRFNSGALGFYKKAYDLFALSFLVQSLTHVAVSALSRLRHDSEQYKRHVLNAISVWAFLGMGAGGTLTLIGKDLIRVLLGPGWEPAGQIFVFFGPGFGITFLYGIHGWIHLSIGKPGRWFKWAIIEFLVTGSMFVLSLPWGPKGIAMSWSLSLFILTVPALWYAGRPIQFGVVPMIARVWKFVAAALLAGCATAIIGGGLANLPSSLSLMGAVMRIVKTCLLFGALYTAMVIILHGSFKPLYQVAKLLRETVAGSGSSKAAAAGPAPVPAAGEK